MERHRPQPRLPCGNEDRDRCKELRRAQRGQRSDRSNLAKPGTSPASSHTAHRLPTKKAVCSATAFFSLPASCNKTPFIFKLFKKRLHGRPVLQHGANSREARGRLCPETPRTYLRALSEKVASAEPKPARRRKTGRRTMRQEACGRGKPDDTQTWKFPRSKTRCFFSRSEREEREGKTALRIKDPPPVTNNMATAPANGAAREDRPRPPAPSFFIGRYTAAFFPPS